MTLLSKRDECPVCNHTIDQHCGLWNVIPSITAYLYYPLLTGSRKHSDSYAPGCDKRMRVFGNTRTDYCYCQYLLDPFSLYVLNEAFRIRNGKLIFK